MKFVDEYRDAAAIRRAADELHRSVDPARRYRIMEVCGGHTHAIFRFGLYELLPDNIELIHGPGCPVCVLPTARIDLGLSLLRDPRVIFTSFGDVLRVPGASGSPLDCQARGADVRMVYSPLDALRLARSKPDRLVVFFAIGFETTAPATAVTLQQARNSGLTNFRVHCNHVRIMPALRALLDDPDSRIEAFIGPGHVSTVIGCRPYEPLAREYGRPVVVSGFEPLDLLQSIQMAVRQLNGGEARVENQYRRAVMEDGNPAALRVLEDVFLPRAEFEWRGLGAIPLSGFRLRPEFAEWDAETLPAGDPLPVSVPGSAEPTACCGEVLRGQMKPRGCPLFGQACTPEHPVGALMVSAEGACAAQFKYSHHRPPPLNRAMECAP